jgi:hypothetical protein
MIKRSIIIRNFRPLSTIEKKPNPKCMEMSPPCWIRSSSHPHGFACFAVAFPGSGVTMSSPEATIGLGLPDSKKPHPKATRLRKEVVNLLAPVVRPSSAAGLVVLVGAVLGPIVLP